MDDKLKKAILKTHKDTEVKSAAEIKTPKGISTGSISLDLALRIPLPPGITEFAGGKGVGKTTIALEGGANAQKDGYELHYMNVERAVNELSMQGIDLDKDAMQVWYPENAESMLDVIEAIIRSGKNKFIVLDSVAAMVSEKLMAESAAKETMALTARLLSRWLPKIATLLERHESVLLLVNQLRDSLNPYGGAFVTPGGKSKDFYSNEQVFFRTNKSSRLTGEEADEYTGHMVTAEVTKNRFAPPYKKASFPIFYLPGPHIDQCFEIAQLSLDFAVVEKSGAWITLPDGNKIQGMNAYVNLLRETPELFDSVKKSVLEIVG
jgi:recombination protein RecA